MAQITTTGLIDLSRVREHHTVLRFDGADTFVHVCFDCDFMEERRKDNLDRIRYRPGNIDVLHTGTGSTGDLPTIKMVKADLSTLPTFVVAQPQSEPSPQEPRPARELPKSA